MLDKMGSQALAGLLTAVVFLRGACYITARALIVKKFLSPKIKIKCLQTSFATANRTKSQANSSNNSVVGTMNDSESKS